MTDSAVVLAVDLGTGGLKVGFVALDGTLLWSDRIAVLTHRCPDGTATQDAGLWWAIIRDAVRRGLSASGLDGSRVIGVSVTGQWASTVAVDADGRPLGPALMWMDTRGAPHSRRVLAGRVRGYRGAALAAWIRRSGAIPSLYGDDPVGHMLFLQHENSPARWFLEPVDYLSMCFTGRAVASPASMMGAWLTDTRRLPVLDYDRTLVRRAGVDPAKLPPLVATGSIIGTVLPGVAAALGISPTAQVVTGIPDLHSAALGSGAVGAGQLHLTISTTSWISCPLREKKTDAGHRLATVPGLGASSYLLVNNQDSAGRALQWLRDKVFHGLGYGELTALAASAPPGATGVIFTPWLKGEHCPIDDRNARGGFHNLSLDTGRADLVRAVLEGVAYNSRWLLNAVEKFIADKFAVTSGPIRIIGGGAQSDLWCQIIADVCGRVCERVADPLNAGLRGAAFLAGVSLEALDYHQLGEHVRIDKVFTPDPENREIYNRIFAEFPRLYRSQRSLFARLSR